MTKLLLLAVAFAACDQGKRSGESSSAAVNVGKKAGIELLGSRPVPPGDLAKIKAGMTLAEVKAALPTARETDKRGDDTYLAVDSGYSNVTYEVMVDGDKVSKITVEVPDAFEDELETIWGPSDHGTWINRIDGYDVGTNKRAQWTILVEYRPLAPPSP